MLVLNNNKFELTSSDPLKKWYTTETMKSIKINLLPTCVLFLDKTQTKPSFISTCDLTHMKPRRYMYMTPLNFQTASEIEMLIGGRKHGGPLIISNSTKQKVNDRLYVRMLLTDNLSACNVLCNMKHSIFVYRYNVRYDGWILCGLCDWSSDQSCRILKRGSVAEAGEGGYR